MDRGTLGQTESLGSVSGERLDQTEEWWSWHHYAPGELILPHQVSQRLLGVVHSGKVQVATVQHGLRQVVGHVHTGERIDSDAWKDNGSRVELRAVEPTVLHHLPLAGRQLVVVPDQRALALPSTPDGIPVSARGSRRLMLSVILLTAVVLLGFAALCWHVPLKALLSRLVYGAASYQLQAGQHEYAMNLLQTSVDLDPRLARAHNDVGFIHYLQGDESQAQAAFQRALAADPTFATASNNLGFSYLEDGQVKLASDALSKAVALAPESSAAWTNLGTVELLAGHSEEAAKAYRAALHLDSDNLAARVNLGALLYEQQQLSEAQEHLKAALDEQPDLARARVIVGAIALAEGDLDRAWREFHLAAADLPDDPALHFYLALWYKEANQWEMAEQELTWVLALEPHPDLAALARSHLGVYPPAAEPLSGGDETKGESPMR